MKIPGTEIADELRKQLRHKVEALQKKGVIARMVDILGEESIDQTSYVRSKHKAARDLGIAFDCISYKTVPSFEVFVRDIKKHSASRDVHGLIIQQPLPAALQTDSIYNFVPDLKEIEGHKNKTLFVPPIAQSVLTLIKYVYGQSNISEQLFIDLSRDEKLLKHMLKQKKIIIIGRGITGGAPIGRVLNRLKVNYMSIDEHTVNPQEYYKTADIIISAVGKHVLSGSMLKPGVVLINVGLRKEGGVLKGDYDERDVEGVASFYSPTPGGIGPIDILYLFNNLLIATELQLGKK
jgi:methylenetetrahydrofolate dehydrogenase (NADP+)/methenyltetrahydrofolate cyclohydrolase